MRRILPILAIGLAVSLGMAAAAQAPRGDTPQLTVFVQSMKMNLPRAESLPGLPPQIRDLLSGLRNTQRSLQVVLWTPGTDPKPDASASLDVPAGLGLGESLPLEIARPQAEERPGPGGAPQQFQLQLFWGSGDVVPEGQPKNIDARNFPLAAMMRGGAASPVVPREGWTHAYWPNNTVRRAPLLGPGATLEGEYRLRSNYAGEVGFDLPAGFRFLDPVSLTVNDGLPRDLSAPLPFSWKPVPGAMGYVAVAMGRKGQDAAVLWTSDRNATGWQSVLSGEGDPKAMVASGSWMAPDTASCTIPAGVLKGTFGTALVLFAYGPGFVQADSTPSVRVQTRSMAVTPLGLPAAFGGGPPGRPPGVQ